MHKCARFPDRTRRPSAEPSSARWRQRTISLEHGTAAGLQCHAPHAGTGQCADSDLGKLHARRWYDKGSRPVSLFTDDKLLSARQRQGNR